MNVPPHERAAARTCTAWTCAAARRPRPPRAASREPRAASREPRRPAGATRACRASAAIDDAPGRYANVIAGPRERRALEDAHAGDEAALFRRRRIAAARCGRARAAARAGLAARA